MAALALTGIAVFTVARSGCADPGRYVQHDDGQVELVDSCLDPATLPPAREYDPREPAEPAVNELLRPDTVREQAP